MKHQTKLIFYFFLITLIGLLIVDPIYYFESKKKFTEQGNLQLKSLATTCASVIDFSGINELTSLEDRKSVIYKRIQNSLEEIVAANDQEGMRVTFAYTLRPAAKKGFLEYIIDGDTSKNHIEIGSLISNQVQLDLLQHLEHPYAPNVFSAGEWGKTMTAFAPIRDEDGKYVATLGLDVYQGEVLAAMGSIERALLYGSIGALVASLILGWLFATILGKPIKKLVTSALPTTHLYRLEHIKSGKHRKINNLAKSITNINLDKMSKKLLLGNFAEILCSNFIAKLDFGGEDIESTILYINLAQLAQVNKELSQDDYHVMVRAFFEDFIDIVSTYGGILNKMARDKAWVIFGVSQFPLSGDEGALQCAKEIKELIISLNQTHVNSIKIKLGFSLIRGVVARAKKSPTECRVPYPLIQLASEIADEALHVKSSILVSRKIVKTLEGEIEFTKSEKKSGEDPLYEPA